MRVVKKPEERKAEMVAAAAKLFAEQGFVRTSVAEIVSAVDVASEGQIKGGGGCLRGACVKGLSHAQD